MLIEFRSGEHVITNLDLKGFARRAVPKIFPKVGARNLFCESFFESSFVLFSDHFLNQFLDSLSSSFLIRFLIKNLSENTFKK